MIPDYRRADMAALMLYSLICSMDPIEYPAERGCRQTNNLWLAVTNDKYELPLIVADTGMKLSEDCGMDPCQVSQSIHHGSIPRKLVYGEKIKFVKVKVDTK